MSLTPQRIDKKLGTEAGGFPWRRWNIRLVGIDDEGNEYPLTFVKCVTYELHESFSNPVREVSKVPFKIGEKAWGEFPIPIEVAFRGTPSQSFDTYLSWDRGERYEDIHTLVFDNPSASLRAQLSAVEQTAKKRPRYSSDDGEVDVDGDAPSARKKPATGSKSKDAPKQNGATPKHINMNKLAERLENLEEDDLLEIVDLVNKYRNDDMYVIDSVEGELTMDLYTLSDKLLQKMWSFTEKVKNM